jgi:hypothetical protein
MVHWLGEGTDVMICLARDPPLSPNDDPSVVTTSPSTSKQSKHQALDRYILLIFLIIKILVFVSYDYGNSFVDKTENFVLKKNDSVINSTVDLFVTHPKFNTVIKTTQLITLSIIIIIMHNKNI